MAKQTVKVTKRVRKTGGKTVKGGWKVLFFKDFGNTVFVV